MAKKKSPEKNKAFKSDPFGNLKGFAGSRPEDSEPKPVVSKVIPKEMCGSFADEMALLGVEKLAGNSDKEEIVVEPDSCPIPSEERTDEEIFLAAMDSLPVSFKDQLPAEKPTTVLAEPRRLKQMKRGKIVPDARLDLHGCVRVEIEEKLNNFIQNGKHNNWSTLLVITGKGLHSQGGEAILRDEVEKFLCRGGKSSVAEWGRAPKQYGGNGALVLFLRKE